MYLNIKHNIDLLDLLGDPITQQFCAAVLSSLSFYESCRVKLCDLDIISALKNLSNLSDDITKQRCLVAYANLSCEKTIQVRESMLLPLERGREETTLMYHLLQNEAIHDRILSST